MNCVQSIVNDEITGRVTSELIRRSRWFQITPLPDGMYEIAVKSENDGLLNQAITAATPRKKLRCPKCGNTEPDEFTYQELTLVEWDVRHIIDEQLILRDEFQTLESRGPGIVVCQRRYKGSLCLHEFHWGGTEAIEIDMNSGEEA